MTLSVVPNSLHLCDEQLMSIGGEIALSGNNITKKFKKSVNASSCFHHCFCTFLPSTLSLAHSHPHGSSDATRISERIAKHVANVLVPLVVEEIIESIRRISHDRTKQRIVEEIVKEVREADQGQSTLKRQPSDSCADTSCTGTGIVANSEQPAFESNPAGNEADLAEIEKSLAAVPVSVAASKNSCTHVTSDNEEVSAKTFAEESKTLASTTHVLGSETGAVDGHTYPLLQVCSFTGVHPTVDLKGFDVVFFFIHAVMVSNVRDTESSASQ